MTDDKYGYGNIIIINIRERISNDVSIVARRFAWGYTPCIRLLRRQNRNENIYSSSVFIAIGDGSLTYFLKFDMNRNYTIFYERFFSKLLKVFVLSPSKKSHLILSSL